MARRFLLPLCVGLALLGVTGSALATGPAEHKQQVDQRLANLQSKIAAARAREQALTAEIASSTNEIQALEQQVGDVSRRLDPLERDLALHQKQLDGLNELFRLQTKRLHFLRRQHRIAATRLSLRLVAIYESETSSDTIEIFLTSTSLSDLIDRFELTGHVAAQDKRILHTVTVARNEIHRGKVRTRHTRKRVADITRVIAARTAEVRNLRDSLVAQQNALSSARSDKQQSASALQTAVKQMLREAAQLQQVSAELEAKIQSAEGGGGGTVHPPSSGLIWPVNGPVTSPFGYRCLYGVCGLHPGIDIGVPEGTPIHAAAAGTVIYAAWLGGYGNLIVIDHGGSLSTAYAHQSRFAVTGGHVSQGQVIGYVGNTGYSFGPHLHFEVRVNGKPVDPMAYL
jgi:murein DD-endopeptidase MepM/ murein hydrolase activator NlpD